MKSRHFLQLVGLSALWGASFLFIRVAVPEMGPLVLAGCRVALAGLTLALIMRGLKQQWPWRYWRELLLMGGLSVAVPFLLYAWAGLRLPAGYSALLNTTAVLFGTLASSWFKEDTLTARKLLGCVCGFVGVGLIVRLGPVQPDAATIAAALACVLAAACYGCSTPLMKRATTRMQPLAIAAGIHAGAMVLVLPGALWAWPQATFTPTGMAAVLVMGVVTSGLAYWAHLRIIRHVTPVAAMSPVFLIPVFGVTWGHLFLGEALSSGIFVGGALVLLASALVTGFNPLRRSPPLP
ncbi:MAG: EamA family transporter [Hydrogenophaga sp.]|uniref:DMT family transporter n=1 Tax=Hydrogenophaga sp. TaxID=1904254 RepID=UPI0025BDC9EA|nr:DMT family transporter [Hydrogenophaga sp.]MBU7576153.1 EamA family transporter [Hydrogenophaga sp.]